MPFCCIAYTANGNETARTEGQEIAADFQSGESKPVICFLVICLSSCFVLGELVIRNVARALPPSEHNILSIAKGDRTSLQLQVGGAVLLPCIVTRTEMTLRGLRAERNSC